MLVGWLEFNVHFQHKYCYIRDKLLHIVLLLLLCLGITSSGTQDNKTSQLCNCLDNSAVFQVSGQ